jgi:hypothetical protein
LARDEFEIALDRGEVGASFGNEVPGLAFRAKLGRLGARLAGVRLAWRIGLPHNNQREMWSLERSAMTPDPVDVQDSAPAIPDTAIVDAVVSLLRGQEDLSAPVYLATLGHRLSAYFHKPLRDILGDRKLRTIIERTGNGRVLVDGPANALRARLFSGGSNPGLGLRYDPAIWAAFAKPTFEGRQRVIKPRRPFSMADHPDGPPVEGWIAVDHNLIPATDMSKVEREDAIKRSIIAWCEKNSFEPDQFTDLQVRTPASSARPLHSSTTPTQIANHILSLLELIPPNKRATLMISLEMVYDILKAGR